MNLAINGRFYAARPTGVQRFARDASARLYEREDVTLFLPGALPRPAEVPAHVRVDQGRLRGHVWEQLELPCRTRMNGADVVLHLSGSAPGWGGPNVVVVYDVTPLTHPDWFTRSFRMWFRLALGRSARRAPGVITISEWTRREVERVLAVPRSRIRVVGQGLEPFSEPAPASAVASVRARWNLPEKFLLAVGGRNPRKNLKFLLDMLGQWRERSDDAPTLLVVGEEYTRLHARAEMQVDSGVDVRLLGHVGDSDLHALYTAAAAFCFPSLAEGFGRPPLEAMACGTPAVVADYECAAEVLGDAAVILPLQTSLWIERLTPLLSGGAERQRLAAYGRQYAARYSWDRAIDDLLEGCRDAARGGREAL